MMGRYLALALAGALVMTLPENSTRAGDEKSSKSTRVDATRMHQLIQVVQTDPDDMHRKAAILELGHVDSRHSPEAMQAIVRALRKDVSAAVRLTAIEVVARSRLVFATAGFALEEASEGDPSLIVRNAARQALWEYHLIGYKSVASGDGLAPHTAEPPLAKGSRLGLPITAEPPILTAAAQLPAASAVPLPAVAPLPGPRVFPSSDSWGVSRLLHRSRPLPNLTVEPPVAARPTGSVTSAPIAEPPIRAYWPEPLSVGTPHPFAIDLPPIVIPPEPARETTPVLDPTTEPPIRKSEER